MHTGFLLRLMRRLGTRKNWWLHNTVNVPTATVHLKMVTLMFCDVHLNFSKVCTDISLVSHISPPQPGMLSPAPWSPLNAFGDPGA